MLFEFSTISCSAKCGPPWEHDVLNAAKAKDLPPPSNDATDNTTWETPYDVSLLSHVFIKDFLNGLTRPKGWLTQRGQQRWFGWATLHAVSAVFPPLEVLLHEGGGISISKRKLLKGDARCSWKLYEVMLGFGIRGESAAGRTVAKIQDALDKPRNYMMFGDF